MLNILGVSHKNIHGNIQYYKKNSWLFNDLQ